jgi:hypothetical protein
MNDEQLQTFLQEGFKAMDTTPDDVVRSTRQVMERKTHVRQRSRWLPFPVRHRRPQSPTTTDTTAFQPSSMPATDGQTPTVIGRTQPMFSPSKALITGALVFGIGGVMLIAQPFDQQSNAPGAEVQPPQAPTAFSATYSWSGRSNPGSTTEYDDGTIVSAGQGWMFDSRESSDPRFAGPLVLTVTDIRYPDLGGGIGVGGYRIETDEGAWQQVPTASASFLEDSALWASGQLPPADNIMFHTFIGEGDYEGLTAVVQETWWPGGVDGLVQLDGYIFEGDLPDAPERWVP